MHTLDPATSAGAIWFSRGFKEHTNGNLTELELGYNEIKDEGACALAQVRLMPAVQPWQALSLLHDWLGSAASLQCLFALRHRRRSKPRGRRRCVRQR